MFTYIGLYIHILSHKFYSRCISQDSCLFKYRPMLFDSATIGQYFGGTELSPHPPSPPWTEANRLWQLHGKTMVWKRSQVKVLATTSSSSSSGSFSGTTLTIRQPYIDDIPVVNIHIHSKVFNNFDIVYDAKAKQPESLPVIKV